MRNATIIRRLEAVDREILATKDQWCKGSMSSVNQATGQVCHCLVGAVRKVSKTSPYGEGDVRPILDALAEGIRNSVDSDPKWAVIAYNDASWTRFSNVKGLIKKTLKRLRREVEAEKAAK